MQKIPMIHKLTKALVIALIFLLPTLMATVASSVSTSYLLILIIGLFNYKKIAKNPLGQSEKLVLLGFLGVFVIYLMGMLNSNDIYKGFKVLGKFHYFLFAIPVYFILKKYKNILWKNLDISFIIAGLSLLLFLIINKNSDGAYHTIMYGSFAMLIAGANLLTYTLTDKNILMKSLLLASGVAAIAASLIVGARGSWVALPILAILLLILFVKRSNTRQRITVLIVLLVLAISSVIMTHPEKTSTRYNAAMQNLTQFIQDESAQEADFQLTSTGARLAFWKSSIETFKINPIFGSGSGDFKLELNQFIKNNPKYEALGVGVFGTAHSIYFEWLALFGGLGFIGLMTVVFLLPLQYFYREIKNNSQSLVPAIIGVWIVLSHLIFGLTETWIVRSAPNGVYVFYILLFMAFCHQPIKTNSRKPSS